MNGVTAMSVTAMSIRCLHLLQDKELSGVYNLFGGLALLDGAPPDDRVIIGVGDTHNSLMQ